MTTIEKIKSALPHMRQWGQIAAADVCEQAAAELEALQKEVADLKETERDWDNLNSYVTEKLGSKGDHGPFQTIDNAARQIAKLKKQNEALVEACRAWLEWYEGCGAVGGPTQMTLDALSPCAIATQPGKQIQIGTDCFYRTEDGLKAISDQPEDSNAKA